MTTPSIETPPRGAPRPTLLYILSPSYSGSTLLTYLLAQHPRVATIGELKATGMGDIDKYTCSCGQLIRACSFWQQVRDNCSARGIAFSVDDFGTSLRSASWLTDVLLRTRVRGPAFERARHALLTGLPGVRAETRTLLQRNFELSQVICALQKRDVFLDGSKDAPRLLHFVRSGLWDVRTIFLIRDGRGVTNSLATRKKLSVAAAAAHWSTTITEDLNAVKLLDPARTITIKYERMCADPAATLAEIWRWLGVESVPYGQALSDDDQHILGNEMRLKRRSTITLDERWRRDLGADALGAFERVVGGLNRGLGYT